MVMKPLRADPSLADMASDAASRADTVEDDRDDRVTTA
jgi:hypothetical protein